MSDENAGATELRRLLAEATPGPWRTHDTWLDQGGYTAVVIRDDKTQPWVPMDQLGLCSFCAAASIEPGDHMPGCPWRRAVEWVQDQ